MEFTLKTYQPEFLQAIKKLYRDVMEQDENTIFWWPGEPEFTWEYCICAFAGEELVGKGQVQAVSIQKPGINSNAKHHIYVNIKLHPKYKNNTELFSQIYDAIYDKAIKIQDGLSHEFQTLLCVGNASTEESNNTLFLDKGFSPFNYLYGMETDLSNELYDNHGSIEGIEIDYWKMETEEDEKRYLEIESIIWPENALSPGRLQEYKGKPGWTAIIAVNGQEIVGSVMCWEQHQSGEVYGEIEDLFVLPDWRGKGIAKALLVKALQTLKDRSLERAELMVLTENASAISLYKGVGFEVGYKENRYFIPLV